MLHDVIEVVIDQLNVPIKNQNQKLTFPEKANLLGMYYADLQQRCLDGSEAKQKSKSKVQ